MNLCDIIVLSLSIFVARAEDSAPAKLDQHADAAWVQTGISIGESGDPDGEKVDDTGLQTEQSQRIFAAYTLSPTPRPTDPYSKKPTKSEVEGNGLQTELSQQIYAGLTRSPTPRPTEPLQPPLPYSKAVVATNSDKGSTNLQGLQMFSEFFDFVADLCTPSMWATHRTSLLLAVCEHIPKFGMVWNQPGNATNGSNPLCNQVGCNCDEFPLDSAHTFFWFGMWVPPGDAPWFNADWSGGAVCLVLRTAGVQAIAPGTGAIKLETSLLDILTNFLTPGYKEAVRAALAIVTSIGVGFSIDRSLLLDLDGQPELLVNARRREGQGTAADPLPREYFWACKDHTTWAFPTASTNSDPYCSTLKGHIWMSLSIDLAGIISKNIERGKTKPTASSTGGSAPNPDGSSASADEKFDISNLFSFSLDVEVMFSADDPNSLQEDVTKSLTPALAFSLFILLLRIQFSIMFVGSVVLTLKFSEVSDGMFDDWAITMAALLLYFRKGGSGAAFYLTYSRGEAADTGTMDELTSPTPSLPEAKQAADGVYKDFEKDNVKDCLEGNDDQHIPGGVIPTGVQFQIYAVMTGCSGTFPNFSCNMHNVRSLGFGAKIAIMTGGDAGFSVYIEKPLEDPTEGKPDTLVICISNLSETEKNCINLGWLLWLLACLGALADMMVAVGTAILAALEEVGRFFDAVAEFHNKALQAAAQAIANTPVAQAVGTAAVQRFMPGLPTGPAPRPRPGPRPRPRPWGYLR